MNVRLFVIGASAASLLAISVAPAAAQVGDFFCSTFNIGCAPPPPPPPPPPPAPVEEAPVVKKKVHHRAKVKRTAAPKAEEPAAAQ